MILFAAAAEYSVPLQIVRYFIIGAGRIVIKDWVTRKSILTFESHAPCFLRTERLQHAAESALSFTLEFRVVKTTETFRHRFYIRKPDGSQILLLPLQYPGQLLF